MFFSVVIPTYNRADILEKCLEALFKQSIDSRDFEIIVVSDGSTDNTDELIKTLQKSHSNLRYLKQVNQGQGIARNNAIKLAKGEITVLIGDDIIPSYDFLFEHQKFHYMHEAENEAVLGFTAWHPALKINSFMEWVVNGSVILGKFGGHQFAYEKLKNKDRADYNFFYTSNISLKTSLLKKYPFDPIFSGYGWEDIELGYRLTQKENLKLYYNSWAIAYHDHYLEENSLKKRMESIGKSAWIFNRKYPQLKKVPRFMKWLILRLISLWPVIIILDLVKILSGNRFYSLYYYCLSKRYFLKGLKIGREIYGG